MSNGHAWSSIKQYTLSEIGAFFVAIIELERAEKIETLSNLWIGNNVDYEGLKETIKNVEAKPKKQGVFEAQSEWNRLKSFLGEMK